MSPLRPERSSLVALVVFLLAGVAATAMIRHGALHDHQLERTRVANLVQNHANTLQRNIEHALSASHVLAALVRQGKGSVPAFDQIATEMLPLYPGVSELALGPGGIIRNVVPKAGNEKALGLNLLKDPAQQKEALAALSSERLTLAGPLNLIQGGVGVIGRLPVFLADASGKSTFWGFTLVVVLVPEMLRGAGLPELVRQDYAYELSRIDLDDGSKKIIAASSSTVLSEPVMQTLQVSNATWTLSVMPAKGWGNPLGIAPQAALGLLFSLLLGFVAKLLAELLAQRHGLEALVSQRTVELQARAAELHNFRLAMDASADAIYLVDRNGMRFIDVNEAACKMLGRTHDEVMALGPDGVLSVPRQELERIYDSIIAGGPGTEPVEMPRQREDGTKVWVELRRRVQRSNEGWVIVTTVRDITERKRAEKELRERAKQLRLFADNVPAMTSAFDANLHLLFINKRYAEFFGHGETDLIGKHLRDVVGEHAYGEIEGYFAQVLTGQPVTYQRAGKFQNNQMGYLQIKLLPHIGEQGEVLGCFAVTTDITEHKQIEERIQRVAHHDSLTGLPNRLLFNDRLAQAISRAKRDSSKFALLYLDLDKFKPVNDTLGHSAGDELLQAVAHRIRGEVRESDTLARVGGDEFAMILSSVARPEEVQGVASKVAAVVATQFQLGSQKQSVTIGVSIGIAIYPTDGVDAEVLIKAADAAMYRAKQAGGNGRHQDSQR